MIFCTGRSWRESVSEQRWHELFDPCKGRKCLYRRLVKKIALKIQNSSPLQFLELDGGTDEQCENIVKCNIESVNAMTSLVLPQMADRKSGAVINISSLSAGSTCPLLTVYSATKAYVDFFTRGLAMEYESQGSKLMRIFLHTPEEVQ